MGVLMAVAITGKDKTAHDVCAVSAKCKDAKAARRMLAIVTVLEGYDRKTAAETGGWIGKRCRIGFIVITLRGQRGCQTGDQAAGRPG